MFHRSYDEKRTSVRMQMDCPIFYRVVDSNGANAGMCINLSVEGMLLETDRKYPVGTKLEVSMEPELPISPPFSAVMEVIRVHPKDNGAFQLAGILEVLEDVLVM